MLKKSFNYPLFVNANSEKSFGVVVVPVEKRSGKFLLLKEWRLPLGNYVLDFPRGFPDKSEKAAIIFDRFDNGGLDFVFQFFDLVVHIFLLN